MADEKEKAAAAAAPAPPAGGGIKALLPLIITVLLMPALAFGLTKFVLLPELKKSLGVASPAGQSEKPDEKSKKEKVEIKRETVPLNKLLVNVAGTMGARYLLTSLSIVGADPNFKEKMDSHDAQIRDMACGVLMAKTMADLEKPGARNLVRTELITGINNILGGPYVEEIYLTEFAIQ